MNRSVFSPQKLIYDKKYDSILRPLARQKENPEEALDADQIGEDWKKIAAMRDNEIVEAEVKPKAEEKSGATEVETGLEAMCVEPPRTSQRAAKRIGWLWRMRVLPGCHFRDPSEVADRGAEGGSAECFEGRGADGGRASVP